MAQPSSIAFLVRYGAKSWFGVGPTGLSTRAFLREKTIQKIPNQVIFNPQEQRHA